MEHGPRDLGFYPKFWLGEGEHGVLTSFWAVMSTHMNRVNLFRCEVEGETLILVDEDANFYESLLSMSD